MKPKLLAFARRHLLGIFALVLALVVVAPLLAPGFTLVYDMVFVPKPHLRAELLGLSPAYPRTVPTQLLVTLGSIAASGQVVQKAVLITIFALAALGAARLTPARRPVARIAAGVLYAWNPFTYERLLLGQWALLLGYAVLPWAVSAAIGWRRGDRGAGWRLVLAFAALTAATPYAGLIGGVTAMAVSLWPPRLAGRRAWTVPLALLVVSLPWLVPALVHPGVPDRPVLATRLFAARSDSPVGTVGSLLSLGGLWRPDLAPPGRSSLAWVPAFLLVAVLAAYGYRRLRDRLPKGATRGLAVAAGVSLLLAAAPALPGLRGAMEWISKTVPGAGILRDSQKFVMPWAVLLSAAFGTGVERALEGIPSANRAARGLIVALPLVPVALAPTLAWAAWGRLHTASYPASWAAVERVTTADPVRGAMLTLPWHAYLPYSWNGDQTVHQPAPMFFSRRVVAATDLEVGGRILPGEDPWSRLARPAATGPGPLAGRTRALGIRYVLLFKKADYRKAEPKVRGLRLVLESPDLALYMAPRPSPAPRFDRPPAAPVVAGDILALGAVAVAAGGAWRSRKAWRRRWRRAMPS